MKDLQSFQRPISGAMNTNEVDCSNCKERRLGSLQSLEFGLCMSCYFGIEVLAEQFDGRERVVPVLFPN